MLRSSWREFYASLLMFCLLYQRAEKIEQGKLYGLGCGFKAPDLFLQGFSCFESRLSLLSRQYQALRENYINTLSCVAKNNPGMEHNAGVEPGGEFIVVCDSRQGSDEVVADFSLAKRLACCCDLVVDVGGLHGHAQFDFVVVKLQQEKNGSYQRVKTNIPVTVLGARMQGRAVGWFGDVGLYSFDKGKNITTLQGGALVADSGGLSEALESVMAGLRGVPPSGTLATLLNLPLYALLLRPWMYGAVRRLPLGLGLTPYDTEYPIAPHSRSLAGLAALQLERLGEINGARIRNAARLGEALAEVPGLSIPRVLPGAQPVYTRFPVLVEAQRRDGVIAGLEQAGIGATASYPRALVDVSMTPIWAF